MKPEEDKRDEGIVQRWVKDIGQIPVPNDATQHAVARARDIVLNARQTIERAPQERRSVSPTIGEFIARHRVAFAATAALLVVLASWFISLLSPNLAMAQTAKAIRGAKSYVLSHVSFVGDAPGDDPSNAWYGKQYWKADGKVRSERYSDEGELLETTIRSPDAPGIEINHEHKVYFIKPQYQGPLSVAGAIEKLSRFDGKGDRDLGTRKFGETIAKGFQIDTKKIDPDFHEGNVRIWVDPRTDLPLEIEYSIDGRAGTPPGKLRLYDIRWNVDIDDRLLQPTPPAGYSKRTRSIPSNEEQVVKICVAFRIYAELLDGHYPRVTKIYPDKAAEEIAERHGINPWNPKHEDIIRDEYTKVQNANAGFGWLYLVFQSNPGIKYYGKTVGPKDSKEVLVRWKLEDGRYQVIYGDLRSETVTIEKLRTLEAGDAKSSAVPETKATSLTQPSRPYNRKPRLLGHTFNVAPTCHWRCVSYDVSGLKDRPEDDKETAPIFANEEGWFVPSVGLRIEVRDKKSKEPATVLVQNERWRYVWDIERDIVSASHPGSPLPRFKSRVISIQTRRQVIEQKEELRAEYTSEMDERDEVPLEKITFRFLADSADNGFSPIHRLPDDFPERIQSPDAKFRTRVYWFDPTTGLVRGRTCGCRVPKHDYRIEYPESIPLELFAFEVPPHATLVVEDNDLGRKVTSRPSSDATNTKGQKPKSRTCPPDSQIPLMPLFWNSAPETMLVAHDNIYNDERAFEPQFRPRLFGLGISLMQDSSFPMARRVAKAGSFHPRRSNVFETKAGTHDAWHSGSAFADWREQSVARGVDEVPRAKSISENARKGARDNSDPLSR